jgi:hypothetical protein
MFWAALHYRSRKAISDQELNWIFLVCIIHDHEREIIILYCKIRTKNLAKDKVILFSVETISVGSMTGEPGIIPFY